MLDIGIHLSMSDILQISDRYSLEYWLAQTSTSDMRYLLGDNIRRTSHMSRLVVDTPCSDCVSWVLTPVLNLIVVTHGIRSEENV